MIHNSLFTEDPMIRTAALSTALAATLFAGCVQQNDANPVMHALPTADAVKVDVPESQYQQYALGQIADYYRITRQVSRTFNGGAAWVLILVHHIVQHPATLVEGKVYTWGPYSDALDPAEWRLVVTELDDGSYDWRFDGRNKTEEGSDFLTVISGNAVPGSEPNRGRGNFFIDFDAAEAVNPLDNDEAGTVEVVYDLEPDSGAKATLQLHIEGPQETSASQIEQVAGDYAYTAGQDGSGDFQFSFHADINEDGSAYEDAVIRSRWVSTGEGRSDVRVQGGDLGDQTVTASECWDQQFRRTFYSDSEEWMPTEGDEATCAFADQDLPDA